MPALTIVLALGAVATALTAIALFLAKVVLPVAKTTVEIVKDYPIVRDIAERYGSDEGGELISAEFRTIVGALQASTDNQAEMVERLAALDQKLSETRHSIIGKFTALPVVVAGATSIVEALEHVAADLKTVHGDLADLTARLPPEPE